MKKDFQKINNLLTTNLSKNLIGLAKVLSPIATLYIVGGFNRDLLAGKKPKDIDLASKLTLLELKKALSKTNYKLKINNEKAGTATIFCENESYEYTTFRKDLYDKIGSHYPKKVEFIDSLEEDINRRDFTINAIYLDILSGEIKGAILAKNDIIGHVIRAINEETLNYDGERILRMIKYAVTLNFKIESKTFCMAKKNYKNVYSLNLNMIQSYKQYFNTLPFFKRLRARKLIKKLNLKNILI